MALAQPEDVKLTVKEENNLEYNPYQKPANIQLARNHGKAKKVYRWGIGEKYQVTNSEICPCCGLPVEGREIALTADLKELYHLGSGFALYFKFIKYSIGILVLLLCITGFYNLFSNSSTDDCAESNEINESDPNVYCLQGYIISFTIANKRNHTERLGTQLCVNLASVLAVIFFFQYLRYQFRKTEIEAEDQTTTPSDYTISIDKIPPNATEEEIIQWLEGFGTNEVQVKVKKVIKPYVMCDYIELTTKINESKQQQDELKKNSKSLTPADELKCNQLDAQLKKLETKLAALKKTKPEYASIAYVIFERADHASYITTLFKKSIFVEVLGFFVSTCFPTKYQFQGYRVEVKRAPEPTDILWENLGANKTKQATLNRLMTNFVSLVLILLSLGLIVLINWGQSKAADKFGKKSFVVQVFSIVASVVIVMTNSIIAMTIDYLTKFEKHHTYTHYLKGVALKLGIAQSVNTALSTLLAELFLSDVNYDQGHIHGTNFYKAGGLFESIYWVFISNSLLTPILTIFDFSYIYKWVLQIIKTNEKDEADMIQKDAHSLFEGSNMALPAKYAVIIKVMLMACFYAPALPFSLIYPIIGLILIYWADKWTLLRRHALPKSVDDSLTDSMVEFLEWATCTFSLGNILYVYTLENASNEIAFPGELEAVMWVTFGVSVFHIFFPMEALNKKLFPIKDEVTEARNYDEASLTFTTDYEIENPSTRKKALASHIMKVRQSQGKPIPFLANLKNSHVGNLTNIGSLFGGKENDAAEHDYDQWDNYAVKVQNKENKALGNFFDNVNSATTKGGKDPMAVYFSEFLGGTQGESPLEFFQPNQEASREEKGGLIPWIHKVADKLPGRRSSARRSSVGSQGRRASAVSMRRGSNGEEMLDLGALNFIVSHYNKEEDKKSKKGPESSGNIDSDDCVEESEPTAREFTVNKNLFNGNSTNS